MAHYYSHKGGMESRGAKRAGEIEEIEVQKTPWWKKQNRTDGRK
jgi:hypothetical protein